MKFYLSTGLELDTRGMPPIRNVNLWPGVGRTSKMEVCLGLDASGGPRARAAVEKWAKRLGAEVVEEHTDERTVFTATIEGKDFTLQVMATRSAGDQ